MRGFSAGDPAGSISGFAEPRQHLANAQPVQRMAPARGDFCGGGKNEDARRHGAMGHRQMPRRLPAQSARPGPAGPEDYVEIEHPWPPEAAGATPDIPDGTSGVDGSRVARTVDYCGSGTIKKKK